MLIYNNLHSNKWPLFCRRIGVGMDSVNDKDKMVQTILLVDDNESVRIMVSHMLVHFGYNVIDAEDLKTAKSIWNNKKGSFSLVLSDL